LDITDRKRSEEERERLESQLQQAQKMEAIGTLAGGIAHDFNNILFPIIGYTEMSIEDIPEDSEVRNNLAQVLQSAHRAKDLVKQILTLSRQHPQETKLLKIQSVVEEALKLLRASIPKTIEIRRSIEECEPVLADSTQIHQIVMNLCTNAYHAMRETGGVLEVNLMEEEISTDDVESKLDLHPGRYAKLTIKDTGHGMDNVVLEKIFDPYYTTKPIGEGSGLGLAVVHGIVKSSGGKIRVESELGEGTSFHIYFPLIDSGIKEPKAIPEEPVLKGDERVLLIDDEEAIVFMGQQMLERLGYHVTTRTSSVEALEAFRANPDKYDLVITDMTMPNMTGIDLAPRLLEIRPDIPIIICTGFSEIIDEARAKSAGIKGYVMKPMDKDQIGRAIRKILD